MSDDLLGDPDDLFNPGGKERDLDRNEMDDCLDDDRESMNALGRRLEEVFDDE